MRRSEKAERIRSILGELFPEVPIPLDHHDPFTLLVAVVLSAQTTDARVNLVTPALFARAPTAHAMSALSIAEIHHLIRTCGLAPAKAKNLSGLARMLVERHGGEVPRSFEELEALPGVGGRRDRKSTRHQTGSTIHYGPVRSADRRPTVDACDVARRPRGAWC